jgi:hypothetical protein
MPEDEEEGGEGKNLQQRRRLPTVYTTHGEVGEERLGANWTNKERRNDGRWSEMPEEEEGGNRQGRCLSPVAPSVPLKW